MDESARPPEGDPAPGRTARVPDPVEALADLEARAAAWSRDERAAEVVDRAVEAYRSVTLAGRFVAALGRELALDIGDAGQVRGRATGAGDGWLLLDDEPTVLVLTDALQAVTGLGEGAAAPAAWPLASRRSVATVLQRQVQDGAGLLVTTRDGARRRGRGLRVGADFLELRTEDRGALLVPTAAIAVVRRA